MTKKLSMREKARLWDAMEMLWQSPNGKSLEQILRDIANELGAKVVKSVSEVRERMEQTK